MFVPGAEIAPRHSKRRPPCLITHTAPSPSNVKPLTPPPAEGLGRFSIDKQIHGDLEATTKGEMFSGGDPKQGAAGYVAIEVVTGTLNGKHGSFALQHSATMDQSGPKCRSSSCPAPEPAS